MKTLSAEVCRFQRSAKGPIETGIAINDGAGSYDVKIIVDINFKPVPSNEIHTYSLRSTEGCFQILAETEYLPRSLKSDLTEDR